MMKAIDTMVGLEKLERAKLGERIRELEKKWNESQQAHDEKVEQMTKVRAAWTRASIALALLTRSGDCARFFVQVISEQEERYKRLEETLLKIVADNEQRVEEAKRAEEFEALKQQLEEVQAKVGTLADEVTAAKAAEERTPAPTTTTTPTSQPVDNNTEVIEKEEKEVKEEVKEKDTTTVAEKNEDENKKTEEKEEEKGRIKPKDVTDDASSPAKKEKQPAAATASPSTPKKKTAKAKTSTAATPPPTSGGDEPDLGVFSPRKGLSKGKDSSGSRFGGLFGGGKKSSASTDSAERERVDDGAKDKKSKKTKDDSKTKGKEKKKEKEKAPKKKTAPAQSKP
jgi:cobalamin biosynthesis Mg chelatase CobN